MNLGDEFDIPQSLWGHEWDPCFTGADFVEIRLVLDFTALPAIGDGRAERAFKTYCWDYRQACEPAWAPPAPEREDFLALSLLDAEGEVCAVLGVNRTGLQTVFRAFQRACVAHARYLDAAYPFEV